MIRSVLFIKTAILLAQPSMSPDLATTYAEVLRVEARDRHFDPVTAVAIVENESRWRAGAVGGLNGACYGLAQFCAHIKPVCRREGLKSASCKAEMAPYLNGIYSLRALARSITAWRRFCRRVTGKPALFYRWLHGFQGYGTKSVTCGMRKTKRGWIDVRRPKLVRKVMRRRLEIIRATERKRR